jgi:hypothetical protein
MDRGSIDDGRMFGGIRLRRLTFELTGPLRWDGLARAGKMYRVPQVGPRQPAVVGPVVQRGVRRHSWRGRGVSALLPNFLW